MMAATRLLCSNAAIECARTGFPAIGARSLSKPIRWLLPPATMIAVSIATSYSTQLLLHFLAERFTVRAPRYFRTERLHHCTHLRFRGGANFRDGFANNSRKLFRTHRGGQVFI